jgi:hypothetical protein
MCATYVRTLLYIYELNKFTAVCHMKVILNRELKTCPMFSNLKTLFLGEWCLADDFGPLISFLDHCPILERLSIELKSVCAF